MGGFNIGVVKPQIWFLTRGPFYGQPKQEVSFYYDQRTGNFVKSKNIEALPDPIRGLRLSEDMENYDNFLFSDGYLEDASYVPDPAYPEEKPSSGSPSSGSSSSEIGSDPTTRTASTAGASRERASQATGVTSSNTSGSVSSVQKRFFTWVVAQNLFNKVVGKDFKDPTTICFLYSLYERPNDISKAKFLTPFFTRNPENVDDGSMSHWGAKTQSSLPLNQPFEVTYYFEGRTQNVASGGYSEDLRFEGIGMSDPGNAAYFALEFGCGSSNGHYLIMMSRDDVPKLFLINGNKATFISKYDESGVMQKIFDGNSRYVTLKVECVMGCFLIQSNVFSGPWVVQGLPSQTKRTLTDAESGACPIKYTHRIGYGAIAVYAGNVQAGWAFRPVQYACNSRSSSNSSDIGWNIWGSAVTGFGGDGDGSTGGFDTPKVTFSNVTGASPSVYATLTLKGSGDNVTGRSAGNILMAEAENISGAEAGGRFYGDPDVPRGLNRSIKVKVVKKSVGSGGGLFDVNASVTLTPSNVNANGFVIKCGRSPYLWMTGLYSKTVAGAEGVNKYNVALDTMSVSLSYNATSYNEITQTGTLKILNPLVINAVRGTRAKECSNGISDYMRFMNRTVYLKIGCHWEKGHGLKGAEDWLFEGMTVGSSIDIEPGGRSIVTFKIADYMNVLEGSKFMLSPYYDGVVGRLAVADIVEQTGLHRSRMKYNNLSLWVSAKLSQEYVLPYLNPLNEPQVKFADGSSFKEAILRIAKYDFKTIYWDRFGNFHYDDGPDILGGGPVPKANRRFYTSPLATKDPSLVVWNLVTLGRSINDVYNVLQVDSIDRNINIRVSANARYYAGIVNPDAVGYLGFRKMLLVRDPALGSLACVKRYVTNFQKKMHIPPRTIRFETFGRYDVRPLDIVMLDSQMVRVLNISYELEAATNKFWMTIDGEWFDEFDKANAVGGTDNDYPPSKYTGPQRGTM